MRAHHPIGDVDVPDLGHVLRRIGVEQRLELRQLGDVGAAQAEAARDRRQIRAAEDRAAVVDAVGAQLVDLGAIRAVVEHADQEL